MRPLVALLLVANLALALYALLLSDARGPAAETVGPQLNADQIRIIAPKPAAPRRRAACVEWGSFADAEAWSARRALEAAQLSAAVSEAKVPAIAGWWVYIPPLKDRAAVDKKIAELRSRGVVEYYAVDAPGPMGNAISLGIFSTEEAADNFLSTLQARGVRSARVGAREHRVTQTAFVIRAPDAQAAARVAELAGQFPGSNLKAVGCPRE